MKISQPNAIKIAAVVTAAPRWMIALLAAEGFILPDAWLSWWIVVSAVLSLGMAVVEGMAFSYIFNAWKAQKDKRADILLLIALFSALVFVGVMSPSISASVRRVPLGLLLTEDWTLHLWSIAVSLSTITIVAGVGYAEKQIDGTGKRTESKSEKAEVTVPLPEIKSTLPVSTEIFEMLPETEKPKITWSDLLSPERAAIAGMTTKQILDKYQDYQLSERTARNWKANAAVALNGHGKPAGDGAE